MGHECKEGSDQRRCAWHCANVNHKPQGPAFWDENGKIDSEYMAKHQTGYASLKPRTQAGGRWFTPQCGREGCKFCRR